MTYIDTSHFTGQSWNKGKTKNEGLAASSYYTEEEMFCNPSKVSTSCIRRYLMNSPEFCHRCEQCGIETWEGEPVPLDLDHIDGNNRNNVRDNLRFICLNCHGLTKTFKGRNIPRKKQKISERTLVAAIKESSNVRQVLIKVGLTPKGANYNRVYEVLNKYELSFNADIAQSAEATDREDKLASECESHLHDH